MASGCGFLVPSVAYFRVQRSALRPGQTCARRSQKWLMKLVCLVKHSVVLNNPLPTVQISYNTPIAGFPKCPGSLHRTHPLTRSTVTHQAKKEQKLRQRECAATSCYPHWWDVLILEFGVLLQVSAPHLSAPLGHRLQHACIALLKQGKLK